MCTLGQGTADPPSHRVSANQRLRYIFVSAIANIVVSVFVYATVLVILFAAEDQQMIGNVSKYYCLLDPSYYIIKGY